MKDNSHYVEKIVYNLNTEEQIGSMLFVPYDCADISDPYVTECCVPIIQNLENKLSFYQDTIQHLCTYKNIEKTEDYGYYLSFDCINYHKDIFDYNLNLIENLDNNRRQYAATSIYILADGTIKYFGLNIRTKDLSEVSEFSHMHKYENLRKSCLEQYSAIPINYEIDLTNQKNISLQVKCPTKHSLTMTDIYENKNEEYFYEQKHNFYRLLVNNNLITKAQHDFIFDTTKKQPTVIKILWSGEDVKTIELETTIVNRFYDL